MPIDVEKRSPIKTPPLRHAGQSIEAQIDQLAIGRNVPWLLLVALVVYLAAMNWVQFLLATPQLAMCVVWTICAIVIVPFAIRQVRRNRKAIRSLKLGLDGERFVSQYLNEQLSPKGYRVFDDVTQRDGNRTEFNIDHVLIGPAGVFVVETKTRSKPMIGDPVVAYDGAQVRVGNEAWDGWPIRQAQANADYIRRILQETTGLERIPVRPVVLFPGWWIEGSSSGKAVWVLEPKALPSWIDREQSRLAKEDVALLASRLGGHIRLDSRQIG